MARRPTGLRVRLLAFAGGFIALALVLAWLVLGLLFERHLERQLQAELERHGLSLIAEVALDAQGRPQLQASPFDPRFSRPAAGLYWQVSASGGRLASASLWDGRLPLHNDGRAKGWSVFKVEGPFEDRVMVVSRDVQLDRGGGRVLVEVASDLAPVRAARRSFGYETGLFLGALGVVLALASWLQVVLGLRPLERVRRDLSLLGRESRSRLDQNTGPREILPLTTAINDLLSAREVQVERARHRARDLAHALKTPLTALRLQMEAVPEPQRAELVQTLGVVSATVEGELARASQYGVVGLSEAHGLVTRLIDVLRRTPEGRQLAFENQLPEALKLPLPDDRAMEVFGALLENAARFARARLVISSRVDETGTHVFIDDDGPGIAAALRHEALNRGRRLDEMKGRHGLGLSIAADHMEASGGQLSLDEAELGGLRVTLHWPLI